MFLVVKMLATLLRSAVGVGFSRLAFQSFGIVATRP